MRSYTRAYFGIKLNIHFTGRTGREGVWRPEHPCCPKRKKNMN